MPSAGPTHTAPLLLLPGDPLPALPGIEAIADRARWLLLVVAPADQASVLLARLGSAALQCVDLELQILAFGGSPGGQRLVPDPEGELARRLGATPASGELAPTLGELAPVAVLVEPRGSVHVACTGADYEAAALAAMAALPG